MQQKWRKFILLEKMHIFLKVHMKWMDGKIGIGEKIIPTCNKSNKNMTQMEFFGADTVWSFPILQLINLHDHI